MDPRYKVVCLLFVAIFATTKVYSGVAQLNTNYYKIGFSVANDASYDLPVDYGIQACVVDNGSVLSNSGEAAEYFLTTTGEQKLISDTLKVVPVDNQSDCMAEVGGNSTLMLQVNGEQGIRAAFINNLKGIFNV